MSSNDIVRLFINSDAKMRIQPRVAQMSITPYDLNSDAIIKMPKFDTDEFKNSLKQIDENVVNESNSKSNDNDTSSRLSIIDEECTGEQEFFKFLFLSAMLNIPQWMLDCVTDLNHIELYEKAKYDE